ncbi:MAG: signal peptidase I [Longimicrobiales bacterium]
MTEGDQRARDQVEASAEASHPPCVSSEHPPAAKSDLNSRGALRFASSLALAAVLFVVVRTFLVEAYRIPTGSMENTLLVGDFLLVNKAVYGTRIPGTDIRVGSLREPAMGDVVVFHPPHEPDRNYVKRVVGLPEDTLEMRDKRLFRNGHLVAEPWARHDDGRGDTVHPDMRWQSGYLIASGRRKYQPTRDNWGPIVVPPDRYFVLGDNRDNSEDSRYWGFVEREEIRGQPWRVYYSFIPSSVSSLPLRERVRWTRIGEAIR